MLSQPREPGKAWSAAYMPDRVEATRTLYLDPGFILGYFLQARLLRVQGRGQASDKALQVCRQLLGEQDEKAPVAQGDGMSCGQLLRLCEQLLEEQHPWPNR